MKQIILDTNFLLIPGQFKVDILSEIDRIMHEPYALCIVEKTLHELGHIIKTANLKDKSAAKLALSLIEKNKITLIKTKMSSESQYHSVDDLILDFAQKNKKSIIVATQDAGLKKRLKAYNIPIITLRNKRHLIKED